MRIAVIGSGIAGLACAWLLSRAARGDAVRGERLSRRPHAYPRAWSSAGRQPSRSTRGFIVYNPAHYPLLTRLFAELGVASQPTTMSFSVHNEATGLEYSATTLDTLFCQRRNLLLAALLGHAARSAALLSRGAGAAAAAATPGPTLGEYLPQHALRRGVPRRAPDADGLGAVVVAGRADPGVSRRATWCSSWPTTRCCRSAAARSGAWCRAARRPMCARCARAGASTNG